MKCKIANLHQIGECFLCAFLGSLLVADYLYVVALWLPPSRLLSIIVDHRNTPFACVRQSVHNKVYMRSKSLKKTLQTVHIWCGKRARAFIFLLDRVHLNKCASTPLRLAECAKCNFYGRTWCFFCKQWNDNDFPIAHYEMHITKAELHWKWPKIAFFACAFFILFAMHLNGRYSGWNRAPLCARICKNFGAAALFLSAFAFGVAFFLFAENPHAQWSDTVAENSFFRLHCGWI